MSTMFIMFQTVLFAGWRSVDVFDIVEKVYLGDTGGALYDGQQQVLYWADVSTELAFVVPSPTSHALAAGKNMKYRKY